MQHNVVVTALVGTAYNVHVSSQSLVVEYQERTNLLGREREKE